VAVGERLATHILARPIGPAQAKETIPLVDAATGRVVKTLQGHTGTVCGVVPGWALRHRTAEPGGWPA
jgi:hypothetical protein